MRPYAAYKESDVPWVGKIPAHWESKPLKHWIRMNRDVLTETTPSDYEFRYIDIGAVGTGVMHQTPERIRFAAAPSRARRVLHRGDTIVSTVRTYLKAVYFVRQDMEDLICSTGFAVLTPRSSTEPEFVSYLVQSNAFTNRITADSIGVAYPGIAEGRLGSFHVAVPPLAEQHAIVRFLRHVDVGIRRYIRVKARAIKLLNEQRQIIVHRLVSRGLALDVDFKPSGVDWVREVPKHWKVVRNGQLFVQRNETGFAHLPILEVSLKTGVRVRDFETSDRKQVMSDREKYKRAVKGDIAYNMMRMWQGAVGVAPVDGLVSPAYVVAKPLDGVEPRYFTNLFRTASYMNEVDRYSRGIVKDRNRLYWEDFKQIRACCPPPDEQVKISDAIDQETRNLNEGIARIEREIVLIQEYRTQLIEVTVTGKLDVRELAAGLPDAPQDAAVLDEVELATEIEAEGDDANLAIPVEEAEA